MSISLKDFSSKAYGEIAALRYNIFESRPGGFALQIAPKILKFYEQTPKASINRNILDVACGTGQLASYFLNRGFTVMGLDRSLFMLKYARANNYRYEASGQSEFNELEMSDFHLEAKFGLVVCTFNGLNHLDNFKQVEGSLACIYNALVPGGYLLFDINTRRGLESTANNIEVIDNEEDIVIRKRIFDGKRIILNASGCFLHDGHWIRYQETIFKIIIDTKVLRNCMLDCGWSSVNFTTSNFMSSVQDPEAEDVAYVVARKSPD